MPIRDYSQTAASNTSISSINIGEGCPPSNINDAIRQALADIREVQAGSTIASAATCNIGAANAEYLAVSGTTTITAFDSVAAGVYRVLKFDGALTLTHNATSLILPGGASITTAANDVAGFRSLGSGNWRCEWFSMASGAALTAAASSLTGQVAVANGGTGASTLTANNVVLGNGTSAVQFVAPGSSGNLLTSNGTTWQSTAPAAVASIPSGSVMDYAGSTAPSGWLLCAGQAVSRSTYADLFTAISTTYGAGDGSTTFNLPDLRGRVAVGKDDMNGTAANRITSGGSGITGTTLGASGGTQTHTLATSEMPAHTHGSVLTSSGGSLSVGPSCGSYNFGNTGSTGGGGAHQNTQPSMILNKIIKT
jgi:microcystin-dependent protein